MKKLTCVMLLGLLLIQPSLSNNDDDDDEDSKDDGNDIDPEDDEVPDKRTRLPIGISRSPKRKPLECFVCAYKAETPMRACLDPNKFRVHTITCHSVEDRCFTSVIAHASAYEAVVRGCRSGCVGSPDTTCCEFDRCNNQAFSMPLPSLQKPQIVYEREREQDNLQRSEVSRRADREREKIISMADIEPPEMMETPQKAKGKANNLHPTVWFFVTILLLLQTVARVIV
ncbi:unnamed protein product [Plutella xylostella]|uniref:(diamondback moth) hypothetical protein n=1 Tax=Plutella xylostella TaxID=51655 RepID=A0A8S4F6D0_PLUXY|nr:uncharacterized protein LOC105381417 [Plutella xylostella]CAG9123243.1 unnamed protein product [Plutella xylostella]